MTNLVPFGYEWSYEDEYERRWQIRASSNPQQPGVDVVCYSGHDDEINFHMVCVPPDVIEKMWEICPEGKNGYQFRV